MQFHQQSFRHTIKTDLNKNLNLLNLNSNINSTPRNIPHHHYHASPHLYMQMQIHMQEIVKQNKLHNKNNHNIRNTLQQDDIQQIFQNKLNRVRSNKSFRKSASARVQQPTYTPHLQNLNYLKQQQQQQQLRTHSKNNQNHNHNQNNPRYKYNLINLANNKYLSSQVSIQISKGQKSISSKSIQQNVEERHERKEKQLRKEKKEKEKEKEKENFNGLQFKVMYQRNGDVNGNKVIDGECNTNRGFRIFRADQDQNRSNLHTNKKINLNDNPHPNTDTKKHPRQKHPSKPQNPTKQPNPQLQQQHPTPKTLTTKRRMIYEQQQQPSSSLTKQTDNQNNLYADRGAEGYVAGSQKFKQKKLRNTAYMDQ